MISFPDRLSVPEDVVEIARVLEEAGFAAWCVGGAIRDNLLGETNTDYDIATSARPEQVQNLFRHTVNVGERFGTVAVRVRRRHHEVTTFRRDVQTDGRHAVVEFGASLDEDLARRDFTFNAIAYHPLRHEWRDPYAGVQDLSARLVRSVGEPARRFQEDYLRILRGLRFAARFDFEIEPATWEAMKALASGLAQLSAERVRDEWFKGLRAARSVFRLVALWIDSGAATVWLPELLRARGSAVEPPPPAEPPALERHQHVGRLAEHAAALPGLFGERGRELPRDPVLLTILLCLDPVAVLSRLKASNAELARAAAVVAGPPEPAGHSPVAVRRWMAAVGDAAEDLTTIWSMRHGVTPLWEPVMRGIRERSEPLSRKALAVTGDDLRSVGITPGPQMGLMLDRLLALVVDDPSLNQRETLLAKAKGIGVGERQNR
jgi:tRNA nucleotidyltransferase/poly(A) polymerase